MAAQIIEGTWEEIIRKAKDFAGRKVRVTILDDEDLPKPNKAMLKALRKVSKRSEKMPVSANDETLKMIREARSGGMFGNDTDN